MSDPAAGVVGATGYLGAELVKLLAAHPGADLASATSTRLAGRPIHAAVPALKDLLDLTLTDADPAALAGLDVVFLATPADVAGDLAPAVLAEGTGTHIVDLSGAHRLGDAALHAATYPDVPRDPALAERAVYGLPELHADALSAGPDLVAGPGCYPTGAALAVLPLVREGLVSRLYVSSVSGISGAGREPSERHHFPEANESVAAYGVATHRHQPEIAQTLGLIAAIGASGGTASPAGIPVTFVPHVAPMDRGIETTAFVPLADGAAGAARDSAHDAAPDMDLDQALLTALYEKAYADAPFVRVVEAPPRTKDVRGTNLLDVHPTLSPDGATVVVNAAHDNLLKGGAGQAVQAMNLLFGLDETAGLPRLGGGV